MFSLKNYQCGNLKHLFPLFNFYIEVASVEKYLIGMIVLAILLAISLAIAAYSIFQVCRLKSSRTNPANKSKENDDLKHVYEIPATNNQDYEQVENEQSTYTALKKPGERDDDDHVYSHLNEVDKGYANQKETGI